MSNLLFYSLFYTLYLSFSFTTVLPFGFSFFDSPIEVLGSTFKDNSSLSVQNLNAEIGDIDDLDDDNDGILDTDECFGLGPELVVNGDFEDAYANWTSDFNRGKNNNGPTSDDCDLQGWVAVSPCASTNGICNDYYDYNGVTPSGGTLITDAYGVGANVLPTTSCNSTTNSCLAESLADHTTGTGFSVYIDPSNVAGRAYWKQTVSVEANKTYYFSAWIMVIEEDPNLEFKIDGQSITGVLNLDRLTPGSDGTDEWQQVSGSWESNSVSGAVELQLVNLTAGCGGNDIRIDDISLKTVLSCDTDNDGIADHLDIDSDNDGITDNTEAQATDSYIAPAGIDTDGDGLDDAYDPDCTPCGTLTGVALSPVDTDGDGDPDFQDTDSDDDDIDDLIEGHDTNGDGVVDGSDSPNANTGLAGGTADIDEDGLLDGFDNDTADPDPTNGNLNAESHPDVQYGTNEQDWREGPDTDKDGIADAIDLDDDNDGIPDNEECGQVPFSAFSVSNGNTETFSLPAASDGFTIDISALDNSFNMNINGVDLVPDELQFDNGHYANGESLVRFASDNTTYRQNGNSAVHSLNWLNHNPSLISLRLRISANGTVSLQGIRTVSSPLEDLIIDPADPQFSTIAWNTTGNNTVIVSQKVKGGTFLYATGYGINCNNDSDGDGIPNLLDLDADNDGIPDLIEAGGVDIDGDGRVDDATDTDNDGLADTFETTNGYTSSLLDPDGNGINEVSGDRDGDSLPNWIDLDADGDGILDIIEVGGTDSNRDGIGDNSTDADGDGYFDMYDSDASDGPGGSGTDGTPHTTSEPDNGDSDSRLEYTAGIDNDGDDVPDFLDVDSDNDGIFDIYEAQATSGYVPPSGNDDDLDGIDNAYDDDDINFGGAGAAGISPSNTDIGSGDTTPDYLDKDSDGDGVPDMQEAWDSIDDGDSQPDAVSGSCATDSDGDGYVDCFDSDDTDADVWTTSVTPPNDDGTAGLSISAGVDIMASNDAGDIFPNNANGNSASEPDWRDVGNAACATATTIYAMTDAGTQYEWDASTQKHHTGLSSGIVRATALCEPNGGWYRFYNPMEPDKFLFAIQNGTNTQALTDVIDYIEIEVEAAPVNELGASSGYVLMARSWYVATKSALNGTVNIRFYFSSTEYNDFSLSANNMMSTNYSDGTLEKEWFKVASGVDYESVPNSPVGFSADNYVDLDLSVAGRMEGQADSDPLGNSKNYVQFNGISSFSGGTFGATVSGTLPVEWADFSVVKTTYGAQLNWATHTEINADFYSIERSIDGNMFSPIGTQAANGTSNSLSQYQFEDRTIVQNVSPVLYYRIKEVDFDGAISYSKIVELSLTDAAPILWLNAMPVPASEVLQLKYAIGAGQSAKLEVYTLTGQIKFSQTMDAGVSQHNLNVRNWDNGIYYLRLSNEQEQLVKKVEVIH